MHITSSSRLGDPVTVELHITRAYFTVTFSTGEVLRLEPQDLGPILLRRLRQRPTDLPAPPTLPHPRQLTDYERVCACGRTIVPFMERCEGCPGQSEQGKLPKHSALPCLTCNGTGALETQTVGSLPRLAKCPACEGTGCTPRRFTSSGRAKRPTMRELGALQSPTQGQVPSDSSNRHQIGYETEAEAIADLPINSQRGKVK